MEREGVSLRYPFKPILVGTFCPDGGDFSDFFLDKARVVLLGWGVRKRKSDGLFGAGRLALID